MIWQDDDWLDPVQAAAVSGMGAAHIRELCSAKQLPHILKGNGESRKHYRIRYRALTDYLKQQERASIEKSFAVAQACARQGVSLSPGQSRYSSAQPTVGRGRGR